MNVLHGESLPLVLVLIGAVFVHACFQLTVSVLTRLSSHTIGKGKSPKRLLALSLSYILGVIIATTSVVLAVNTAFAWLSTYDAHWPTFAVVGLLPVFGLLIVGFYYRRDKGTQLWLPRPFINYLMERAKKTHSSVEATMLGIATVVGELPFVVAPVAIISLWVSGAMPTSSWLTAGVLYAVAVSIPLIFLTLYISSGHKISVVQGWREQNKTFLQWSSGVALLLLDAYLVSYIAWGAN